MRKSWKGSFRLEKGSYSFQLHRPQLEVVGLPKTNIVLSGKDFGMSDPLIIITHESESENMSLYLSIEAAAKLESDIESAISAATCIDQKSEPR